MHHIRKPSLGPAKDVPELKAVDVPTFKAMAALIPQETRDKADQLRREELVEYGEPIVYRGGGLEIEITPAKAREELTPIMRLEGILREFGDRKYTHLRLVVRGEEYELLSVTRQKCWARLCAVRNSRQRGV